MVKSNIIGISGNAGNGKSTLAKALAHKMQATLVTWDDYDDISTTPSDYVEWFESGSPEGLAAWKYPELAKNLQSLKQGESFTSVLSGKIVKPTPWVVFDAPLGRDHEETCSYIDFHVHIETPLDVSLARRILRDFSEKNSAKEILEDIQFYLERSRPMFTDVLINKPDLVVDGLLPNEEKVKLVIDALNAKNSFTIRESSALRSLINL